MKTMIKNPNITPYEEIFDAALSKLKDYDLVSLPQEDCYAILSDYLRPACVKFQSCKKNLKNRDNLLQQFNTRLSDEEIEILSNEVVREYIYTTHIKTPLVLKMVLPSKDYGVSSNANHLDRLLDLHNTLRKENEQLISIYSWSSSKLLNSGIGGDKT